MHVVNSNTVDANVMCSDHSVLSSLLSSKTQTRRQLDVTMTCNCHTNQGVSNNSSVHFTQVIIHISNTDA